MTPRQALIEWMESITYWTTKLDMTFKWNCNEFTAKRHFTRWMAKHLPGSTYLYAIEQDPNQNKVSGTSQGLNQACHVHAISDTKWNILMVKKGLYRKDLWADWKKQYGMNRIEPVKNITEATGYALKKVLNYSEGREAAQSHVRKTDVDWDLVFGKGKHAAKDKQKQTRQKIWTKV